MNREQKKAEEQFSERLTGFFYLFTVHDSRLSAVFPFEFKTIKRHSIRPVGHRFWIEPESQPLQPAHGQSIARVNEVHKVWENVQLLFQVNFTQPDEGDVMAAKLRCGQKPRRSGPCQNVEGSHPEHANRLAVCQRCPGARRNFKRAFKRLKGGKSACCAFIPVRLPHVPSEPQSMIDASRHYDPNRPVTRTED